jgi:hypothetical protein
MDNIAFLDYILSSDGSKNQDSENESNNGNYLNLDSPVVQLPQKIRQNSTLIKEKPKQTLGIGLGLGLIPKLDFSKVNSKYQQLKHVEIAEANAKKSNRSSNDYIEKLKFQLKVCKSTITGYKKKVLKYKKMVQILKQHLTNTKNKNEVLEVQLKKSGASTNDYDPSSNNKNINNTSMVSLI